MENKNKRRKNNGIYCKYKKCPTCKGKGKVKVDLLGRTKEENKRMVDMCAEWADREV